jgi:soluble lytic murein transglycosylase-like protein
MREVRQALRTPVVRRPLPPFHWTEEFLRARAPWLGEEAGPLAERLVGVCEEYRIEPELVLAVIHVESRFHPLAVSPTGARGLMQILPSTGVEVARDAGVPWDGLVTLHDPHQNVELGVTYLAELLERFDGNKALALAAYNQGPGRVERLMANRQPIPSSYVHDVLRKYIEYRRVSARLQGRRHLSAV